MPEAKNTFLKAKMNQDLDDRLLPNGEYRTAQNVLVGKSEEDNVGTLQNIRGNQILDNLIRPTNSFIIGYLMDTAGNRIFAFFTNNSNTHSIAYHTIGDNSDWAILVEGAFLNFSTAYPILNVHLLEDLLFWTDNNNQPRKINITRPSGYYTQEHQISVAKYNPYEPISLVKQEIEEVLSSPAPTTTVFGVPENANIVAGMLVLSKSGAAPVITASNYITVNNVSTAAGVTTVTLSSAATSITAGDKMYFLSSTMSDKSGDAAWPGDPSYLESRFVRFSYRFKFDDNEYSIFAPFTQIAFVPKQKGYFLNGQEQLAVNSTILEWFENSVNNVDLIIPLPDIANNVTNSYKIAAIEILYKESDQIPVKVIDTVLPIGTNNYYIYNYQSRKPIRTLPEAQTVRVYDKVPVKANTQEIISNRVVYGNFLTKHSPPSTINYTVSVQEKNTSGGFENFIEYPNHTVKQNRNYQVGFVLSDKFGRQSDVILSPVLETSTNKGSTIFAPYIPDDPEGTGVPDSNYYTDLRNWQGNSLFLNLLSPITAGEDGNSPGLYANKKGNGFDIDSSTVTPVITNTTYTFQLLSGGSQDLPVAGDYMRGQYVDYVKVISVVNNPATTVITTDGRVNDIYLKNTEIVSPVKDTKFAYTINPLGWYSYKIVVKQTEQEYYNVYLPSAINANNFPTAKTTDTAASVSYITLINDNINKVPRDLAEVGPDQKQYRSSVRLFGRVQPTYATGPIFGNQQYFPLRTADTSTAVGNTEDILGDLVTATTDEAVFQYDSNPIVARISTNKEFGINATNFGTTSIADRFSLAVFETEPVVSALDIYWETSQAGLISDINTEVLTGFDGPVAFDGITDLLNENLTNLSDATGYFKPILSNGTDLPAGFTITLDNVIDLAGTGSIVPGRFTLVQNPADSKEYRVETTDVFWYKQNSSTVDRFQFNCTVSDPTSTWQTAQLSFILDLTNSDPTFDAQTTSPQEYYYMNENSDTNSVIRNFLTQNTPRNGSADPSNNTAGLVWTLGGTDAALFTLDASSGILKPSATGVAAGLNTYEITVTLTDASNGTGALSVTQTYFIVKGYTPSNIANKIGDSWGATFFDSVQGNYAQHRFAWYMSDATLTASQLPPTSPSNLGTYTYATDPVLSNQNKQNPVNVSTMLTQGSFIFGIEKSEIRNFDLGTGSTASVDGTINVVAYWRLKGSSTWAEASDLNNTNSLFVNYENTGSTPEGKDMGYAFFAQNRNEYPAGNGVEFAFIGLANGTQNQFANTIAMSGQINIRDLHYTGALQTQQSYRYNIWPSGGANTAAGATMTGSSIIIYSDNPLAENTEKFFTGSQGFPYTADFGTIYTPPSTQFYVIKLMGGPPSAGLGVVRDRNGIINSTVAEFETTLKIDGTTGLIDDSLLPVGYSNGYLGSFKSRATVTTDQSNTYFDTL